MKILIAGDFCPKYQLAKTVESKDYSSMFGDVKTIVSTADYSIINFECPVIAGDEKPIKKCGPNLSCSERGFEAVRWAGFDCVTLANNHFLDYDEEGVSYTLETSKKYNLDTVGGGLDIAKASKTLFREIAGKTLAIINCCEHEFSIATETTAGSNPLNPIWQYYAIQEAKNKADYVLVIVHGGHEHYQLPSTRMQDLYRFFVNVGADAVINHHQHCFSGMEVYNGKPIFYGLGNFLFDTQNKKLANTWHDGYIVLLILEENDVKFNIIPYRQCYGDLAVHPLLSKKDLSEFYVKFNELCNIVSNRKELECRQIEYYKKCVKERLVIMEPYSGRCLKAAYRRGLLPSLLKNRLSALLNNIECESHRDILQFVLRDRLKSQ